MAVQAAGRVSCASGLDLENCAGDGVRYEAGEDTLPALSSVKLSG